MLVPREDQMSKHREPISEVDGNDEIPAELERALNGSVEDLLHDRTEDVDHFLGRMEAKLQEHLAAKRGATR